MSTKLLVLLCLILVLVTILPLLYPQLENALVFHPYRPLDNTPASYRLDYREVFFDAADGERLHGWFFPLDVASPVLLFYHGNAGNISHRIDNIALLLDRDLQVFIFDYRGYGRSTGKPSETGIYQDGLAAYDYLTNREDVAPHDIILFGRSLGAAVALEVSLQRDARSLVLESAFTSTREMARTMPFFFPLSFLLPAHYNNIDKISRASVPKLIIHGKDDEIVPFSMGMKLFQAAKEPKYFLPLDGATHNDTFIVGGTTYFDTLAAFASHSGL
jgi:hypothetical protein